MPQEIDDMLANNLTRDDEDAVQDELKRLQEEAVRPFTFPFRSISSRIPSLPTHLLPRSSSSKSKPFPPRRLATPSHRADLKTHALLSQMPQRRRRWKQTDNVCTISSYSK